jgi:hypothetical protein
MKKKMLAKIISIIRSKTSQISLTTKTIEADRDQVKNLTNNIYKRYTVFHLWGATT